MTAHSDTADDLDPEVRGQRTLGQHGHYLCALRHPGTPSVSRSQPKKYKSTSTKAPSSLARRTMFVWLHVEVTGTAQPNDNSHHKRRAAHQSAEDTNQGARSAVCHISCPC